jgi:hypothetical protein
VTYKICKETMVLKFRIMDLKRALEATARSTDAATVTEYLTGHTRLDFPRGTKRLVMSKGSVAWDRLA